MSAALDPLAKYTRKPVADIVAVPSGMVMAYRDYYWIISPNEEVLKFGKGSWQCNPHKEVCEHLAPEGCSVRLLPIAFIPVHPQDYC